MGAPLAPKHPFPLVQLHITSLQWFLLSNCDRNWPEPHRAVVVTLTVATFNYHIFPTGKESLQRVVHLEGGAGYHRWSLGSGRPEPRRPIREDYACACCSSCAWHCALRLTDRPPWPVHPWPYALAAPAANTGGCVVAHDLCARAWPGPAPGCRVLFANRRKSTAQVDHPLRPSPSAPNMSKMRDMIQAVFMPMLCQ